MPGDGLDVVDTQGDQNAIAGLGASSKAYLADSMTWCAGLAPAAIGCAMQLRLQR
ncbi:MAG: hypothetical protein R3E53_07225 [Myxococcota bacterium]